MDIFFKPSFIKDFKKLPCNTKEEVRKICMEDSLAIKNLAEFKYADISPIKGFKDYYTLNYEMQSRRFF